MSLQAQDGDKAVTFATLTSVGGSVVNTTTLPVYIWYSLCRRLGGLSGLVRAPAWVKSLDCPAHSKSLYQLSYPSHLPYNICYKTVHLSWCCNCHLFSPYLLSEVEHWPEYSLV